MNDPPSRRTETLPCRQCKSLIPVGARLCRECKSYQDWRGFLNISTAMMALIIAALSVATVAAPVFYKIFGLNKSKIVIGAPIIEGETLRVIVTNTGTMPGAIRAPRVYSSMNREHSNWFEWLNLGFVRSSDSYIAPGSKLIEFDIPLQMSAASALNLTDEIFKNNRAYKLEIEVVNSDGSTSEEEAVLNGSDVRKLLFDHAYACQSQQEQSFDNGCASTEEEARERAGRPETGANRRAPRRRSE